MPSMEQALTAIFLLLPGFIASSVFRSLYPASKQSDFERTLESLGFTLAVLIIWGYLGGTTPVISQGQIHSTTLLTLALIAVAVGAFSAWLARKETLHRILVAFVREASAPGPDDVYWRILKDYGASSWAIVHLKESEDVLIGTVSYLGMSEEHRALFMERVRLMDNALSDKGMIPGPGVIVPFDQIKFIEFYKP